VRLVERADEVLAKDMVDADLPPIALSTCASSGGHVDQRDAAEVGGGRKPSHVPDHAAAKGDDRRRALGVRAHKRVGFWRPWRVLVAFAVRDEDRLALDGPSEARTVKPPDEGLETTNRRSGTCAASSTRSRCSMAWSSMVTL
jgi:hypothetical protein